jgi:hypothetical protein
MKPILHSFQNQTRTRERLPNSFYETNITLIPKPDKDEREIERERGREKE